MAERAEQEDEELVVNQDGKGIREIQDLEDLKVRKLPAEGARLTKDPATINHLSTVIRPSRSTRCFRG